MSQGPFSSAPTPTPSPSGTNGLGIAGLVTSILGILTCGVLSPISLLLSLFGLTKKPKGMAIAGTVISLIGVILLATVGYTVVKGLLLARDVGVPMAATTFKVMEAKLKIESDRDANKALPDDAQGNALIAGVKDGWEHPFQYKRIDDTHYEIRSAGPDGQFNTADDMKDEGTGITITPSGGAGAGSGGTDAPEEEGEMDEAEENE